MPRKKEAEPLEKVTISLFKGDMEKLQSIYPQIGGSKVIRELTRTHLLNIEAKVPAATIPKIAPPA